MNVTVEQARVADDGLVLLANASMRARARPLAIAVLWIWTTVSAALLAWPVIAVVRAAYGDHPYGDAPLWNRGGFELIDLFVNARFATTAVIGSATAVFLASAVLGLLPTAALLASIAFSTRDLHAPPLREIGVRALRAFRPMALLFVLAGLFEGALVGAGLILGAIAESAFATRLGEARAEQISWIVYALFAALVAFVGVVTDLARAAIVRFRVRGVPAIRLALNAARRAPALAFWSWAWRALAAAALVAIGALVADRVDGRGGMALLALAVLHQVIVVTRIALRASWLAKALRVVDDAHRVRRLADTDTDAATPG